MLAAKNVNTTPPFPCGYQAANALRRFHCLFTFGKELRGSETAALWARDGMASPMHVAMLAGDALKIAKRVVILTEGEEGVERGVMAIVGKTPWAEKISFEHRCATRLRLVEKGEEGRKIGVGLDGKETEAEEVAFDFLVHQPAKRQAVSQILTALGVELDARGDIKLVNPFGETTVPGVYAAGDAASLFKIVPAAVFSGASAGAGITRSLSPEIIRNRFSIEGVA